MNYSTLLKVIISVSTLFFLISFKSYSTENNAIKSFEIRPSICVIERRDNCEYQFIFIWELFFSTQVCLSEKGSKEKLICGNELTREVGLNINIASSTDYNLFSLDNPKDKKTRSIDIQRLGVDSRVLQRRIWSVF